MRQQVDDAALTPDQEVPMAREISNQTLDETAPDVDQVLQEQDTSSTSSPTDTADSADIANPTASPDSPGPVIANAHPLRRMGWMIGGLLFLLAIGGFVITRPPTTKPDKAGARGKDQITPVMVATVTQKTVPVQITAIGKVQAGETVSVTPQVGGKITGVFFKKGEAVRKGQLLFTIDDRSQTAVVQQAQGVIAKDQAQVQQARAVLAKDLGQIEQARATLAKDQGLVRQAEAVLAKDIAQAQFAQAQSTRYNNLYKDGVVTLDQAQQYSANSGVSVATLQADREAIANAQAVVRGDEVAIQNAEDVVNGDQAAIETAKAVLSTDLAALNNTKVQSSYTKIYAPIDGQAGNVLVTEGNVVQANTPNPLVVIQKIRPIQVAFSVPEVNLPALQKHLKNGKLKVDVTFAENANAPISGVLTFLNNTVDNTTGTIQLIGDFENAEGKLFPGQFVNTTLTLTQDRNATVVPAQAVQNGPDGQFVFVVKPDDTVENVPVVANSTIEGLDVIQKGVQPGMQVVTDGQANLVTGSKIRIKDPNQKSGDASHPDATSGGNELSPGSNPPGNNPPDSNPPGGDRPNSSASPNSTHPSSTSPNSTHPSSTSPSTSPDGKTPARSGKHRTGKPKNSSSPNSAGGNP